MSEEELPLVSDDDMDADFMAVLFANGENWQGLLDFAEERRMRPTAGGMVADHWIDEAKKMISQNPMNDQRTPEWAFTETGHGIGSLTYRCVDLEIASEDDLEWSEAERTLIDEIVDCLNRHYVDPADASTTAMRPAETPGQVAYEAYCGDKLHWEWEPGRPLSINDVERERWEAAAESVAGPLRERVKELERAIGSMVPTILRCFIDQASDTDREFAKRTLDRVEAAMSPAKLQAEIAGLRAGEGKQ